MCKKCDNKNLKAAHVYKYHGSVEIFKITGINNEFKKTTYNEKDIALFVVQF